jgi:hypothetical protein
MWRVLNAIIGVDGLEVAIVGKKIQLQGWQDLSVLVAISASPSHPS